MRWAIWRGAFLSLMSGPALKRVKPTRWAKPGNDFTAATRVAGRTVEPCSLLRKTSSAACTSSTVVLLIAAGSCQGTQETLSHALVDTTEGLPLTRGTVIGRAFLEQRTVHVADLAA